MTPLERFHRNYIPVPESGCWIWLACCDADGYGFLSVNGRPIRAHRFSYHHFKGAIPRGMMVLHNCDVPFCVCPSHLKLGTQYENMADMMKRGRDASLGERNPYSKLTIEDVRAIRRSRESARVLAQRFGISKPHVHNIKNRVRWAWA